MDEEQKHQKGPPREERPIRLGARLGARVASQRSSILRAGKREYRVNATQIQENEVDKQFATGYDELAGGVEAIGNFNNEGDIPVAPRGWIVKTSCSCRPAEDAELIGETGGKTLRHKELNALWVAYPKECCTDSKARCPVLFGSA